MCLAIPARVVLGEVRREVSLVLLEDLALGDHLLVHVGYALARVSEEDSWIPSPCSPARSSSPKVASGHIKPIPIGWAIDAVQIHLRTAIPARSSRP